MGWRRIVWLDYGKSGFTFYRKTDGKAVRVYGHFEAAPPEPEESIAIGTKITAKTATPAEVKRYEELRMERAKAMLKVPEEKILDIRTLTNFKPPIEPAAGAAVTCEVCKEATDELHTRVFASKKMCIPCFQDALSKA